MKIKVDKIQINENISSKNFLIISLFSLGMLFVSVGWMISNFLQTKDYVKVEATITKISYKDYGINHSNSSISHYLKLKYQYHNKTYFSEQQVLFVFHKIGGKVNIYINPKNPKEVRDNYNFRLSIFLSLIMSVCSCFIIKGYFMKKHIEKENAFCDDSNLKINSPLK